MQNLQKLISVIHAIGEKNIAVFEKQLQKAGKELQLFQGIYTGEYKDEHQAAKSLYQSGTKNTKYGVLKARLEDKLLNFLMVIEFDGQVSESIDAIENGCKKQLYQVSILVQMGEQHIAERLLKRILRRAKVYEFTAIRVESLELLLELYTLTGDTKHYQGIKEEYIFSRNILFNERSAKLLYQQAQLQLADEGAENKELLSSLIAQLQDLWKESKSFVCFDLYYRLHVQQLELGEEYEQLLVLATLADDFVKDLKINNKRFNIAYNQLIRIYACLRTGEIEMGLKLVKASEPLFKPATDMWLSFQENYFLLLMHKGDYSLAMKILEQVSKKPFFDSIDPLIRERWFLYSLYLNWMQGDGKISFILENAQVKQYFPICSKDKQGYNMAILILQFSHQVGIDRKDMLARKAELYKKYIERYVAKDAPSRERIFFLLLLLVIRHNFEYDKISGKSNKLLTRLEKCILPGGTCISKIEIVPYPILWNKIMDALYQMKSGKNKSNALHIHKT